MPARKKPGYKLTHRDYAQIYNCHVNTVSRWQRKGYPLDDPEELVAMLLMQRMLPSAVIEKGMEHIEDDYQFLTRR
jgi:hypothetical protein